jgi:hypothetical protein
MFWYKTNKLVFLLSLFPLAKVSLDAQHTNYVIHISVFQSSSGNHVRCWLHCSPPIFAVFYRSYILRCLSATVEQNVNIFVHDLVKMLNLKI